MMAHHADELLVNFYELSADRPAGWRPPVGSAAPLAVAPAPAVGGARADLVGALWLLPGSTWPIAETLGLQMPDLCPQPCRARSSRRGQLRSRRSRARKCSGSGSRARSPRLIFGAK